MLNIMGINSDRVARHADITQAAAVHGKSLNPWITDTLDQATQNG